MEKTFKISRYVLIFGAILVIAVFSFVTPPRAYAGNFFSDLWDDVRDGAGDVAQGAIDITGDVWNGAGQAVTQTASWGNDVWKGTGQSFNQVASWGGDVWDGAGQVANQVTSWGNDAWKGTGQSFNQVASWGGDVLDGTGQVVTQVGSWGNDILNGAGQSFNQVASWGGDVWNTGRDAVNNVGGWFNNGNDNNNGGATTYQTSQSYSTNNSTNNSTSNSNFQPACPFNAQSGRIIVHFEDQSLSGGVLSDRGVERSYETRSVSIPAGTYDISLQSFDGGDSSSRGNQPNEKYFLQLKNGSTVIAQTNSTNELPDHVSTPVWYGKVNSGLVLSQSINTVVAVHSAYPDSSSPNSVNVGCAAFDLISSTTPPPIFNVSCSATPNSVQTGNTINWSSSVSGGNGSYTYSWSGTDNLSGSSQNTSMNYSNAGSKNASVVVTSGSQSVTANCYANVYQVQDYSSYNYGGGWNTYYYPPNNQSLSGSCSSGVTNTTVGSTVTWTATASGGNGFYTYYWYGDEGFSSNSQYAPKTYSYGGTKNAMVTISSNGQSITRNCSVNVGQVLSYTDTQPYLSSVYLSEIPYTGAGDGLRVTLFVLALTLWSALISYALIGRKGERQPILVTEKMSADNKREIEKITEIKNTINDEYRSLSELEDFARGHKVIISSDTARELIKLERLGKVSATNIIMKVAKTDSEKEWITLGREKLDEYLKL